jgi:hypothetical protein
MDPALESGLLPARVPTQTEASVSTRITEYMSYEVLPSGVVVTARIRRHTKNPPEDVTTLDVSDEYMRTTMSWSNYKQCADAKNQLEKKLKSGWDLLEGLDAHPRWSWFIVTVKEKLSRAKAVLSHLFSRSLSCLL